MGAIVPGYETDMPAFGEVLTDDEIRAVMRRINQGFHIAGMGTSYVVLVTAFYVDNGPKLPFWNQFPDIVFWIGPAAIGPPIIIRAMWRRGYRCIG